jgi:uncharacterized damage-inducible protein DinB
MKRWMGTILLAAAVATCMPRISHADPTAMEKDVIGNMMDAGTKVMELADAFPDKKLDYRPGKGVRSTREVVLHVIGGNYMLPTMLGASTGKTMEEAMKLEKSTPTKAELAKMLKESYDAASTAIGGVPESDLDTQVDFFGQKMSKRQLMLIIASHSHEHLGQLIAYARVNGITPPWTAREQAAAKKAAGDKKSASGM